jgi:hypothetical protein
MWRQPHLREIARRGLELDLDAAKVRAGSAALPRLPVLTADQGGFALELWLRLTNLRPGQIVVDSRARPDGPGLAVSTSQHATLELELTDGRNRTKWACDPGLLVPGRTHQVVFNVDVAPRLITVMVDGVLCDGGDHAQFGYTRFGDVGLKPTGKELGDINAGPLRVLPAGAAGEVQRLRFYERYLTTTEMVGNYRAGP